MTRSFFTSAGKTFLRLAIESVLRAASLPASLAARAGRIPLAIDTVAALQPGTILIFACYPRTALEPSLIAVLAAFAARGVQVVAVSTAPLTPAMAAAFRRVARVVIEMPNIGRDFGAYQQGIAYVARTLGLAQVTRMVFLNDSLYFFRNADTHAMIAALLDPDHAYVGTNENFNTHYHVGSFCFALSAGIVGHPAFARFWRRYLPLSTRMHAIEAGEVGMTRTIMALGHVPRVLYQLGDVAGDLADLVWRRAPEDDYLLSMPARRHVLADSARFASSAQVVHDNPTIGGTFGEIAAMREIDRLLEFVQNHNQTHNLALIFARQVGMPFVKRDIVYRGMFLLPDIVRFVEAEGLDSAENVTLMLRTRRTPATLKGAGERILSRLGFI